MATDQERLSKDEKELEELKKLREEQEKGEAPDPEIAEAEAVMADPEASEEDKNWAKRHRDTKSAWYKERHLKDNEIEELKTRITAMEANQSADLPTDVEGLKAWKDEHPDVAVAIQSIATEIAQGMQKGLEEKVEDLSKKEQTSTAALVKEQVLKTHPDFDELQDNGAFHDWVKDQDEWVGTALYKGLNAKSVINAINLYKLESGTLAGKVDDEVSVKADKQAEIDAAKSVAKSQTETPPTKTKGKLLESEILNWTDEEFEANLSTYKKAKLEGNIIYDVQAAS